MTSVLTLKDLSKTFAVGPRLFGPPKAQVHAVHPVNLEITKGETFGIVGESGCGKSTLARMLVGLIKPTTGTIEINLGADPDAPTGPLGSEVQYIFQDPISSLNPRKTIRQIMETPLIHLHQMDAQKRRDRISEIFAAVNLREEFLERYPHEFSGGQAQRIGIARALAANAKILILDEPVSALDVSVQAQVLNLLADLKKQYDLTYLFISHDLAVVEAVSDRVAVFYFGSVVEIGPAESIFANPQHPYTRLLAQSAPVVGRPIEAPERPETELPDPLNPPQGCAFRARCAHATDICAKSAPQLQSRAPALCVACHHTPFD